MPEPPSNSCYPGGGTWPTCLNGKPKSEIKQIFVDALEAQTITISEIQALANNQDLTQTTRNRITQILNEGF